jgi:hypothetical protein
LLVRQLRGGFAHVQLARHDVGGQAGAVSRASDSTTSEWVTRITWLPLR